MNILNYKSYGDIYCEQQGFQLSSKFEILLLNHRVPVTQSYDSIVPSHVKTII